MLYGRGLSHLPYWTPCDGGNWNPWQLDGKGASLIGHVARVDPAVVRFHAPSAEGKAKTQTGSIGASLLEGTEQFDVVPNRETAAFILDFDDHTLGAGTDP